MIQNKSEGEKQEEQMETEEAEETEGQSSGQHGLQAQVMILPVPVSVAIKRTAVYSVTHSLTQSIAIFVCSRLNGQLSVFKHAFSCLCISLAYVMFAHHVAVHLCLHQFVIC